MEVRRLTIPPQGYQNTELKQNNSNDFITLARAIGMTNNNRASSTAKNIEDSFIPREQNTRLVTG